MKDAAELIARLRGRARQLDNAGDGLGYYSRADAIFDREAADHIETLEAEKGRLIAAYRQADADRQLWEIQADKVSGLEARAATAEAVLIDMVERYQIFRDLLVSAMGSSPTGETAEAFVTRLTDAIETAADALDAAREASR